MPLLGKSLFWQIVRVMWELGKCWNLSQSIDNELHTVRVKSELLLLLFSRFWAFFENNYKKKRELHFVVTPSLLRIRTRGLEPPRLSSLEPEKSAYQVLSISYGNYREETEKSLYKWLLLWYNLSTPMEFLMKALHRITILTNDN